MSEHWLSLDLTAPTATVALHGEGARLLGESTVTSEGHHSEKLLTALDNLLRSARIDLSRITRLIVPQGPGSFTGLRIAYASAKAFALAIGAAIETVGAAEARAIAWADEHPGTTDSPVVLTHLTHDKVARAGFRRSNEGTLECQGESVEEWGKLKGAISPGATVLHDGRVSEVGLQALAGVTIACFPLRARHLAQALERAKSRRTYTGLHEWIQASPRYFGDTRFGG